MTDRLFEDKTQSVLMKQKRQLLSRDLCQNLLYPAPQLMEWFRPAGSRVAFLISMEDMPSARDHEN